MNPILFYNYGANKKYKHNTFIGGVAATITSRSALALRLGIPETKVNIFEIKGSDVRASVSAGYTMPNWAGGGTSLITFFLDPIGISKIRNAVNFRNCSYLKRVEACGLLEIGAASFGGTDNIKVLRLDSLNKLEAWPGGFSTFLAFKNQCSIYLPNLKAIGSANSDEGLFNQITNSIIYVHPFLATNNAGGPDADLVAAVAAGNTVVYVLNQTPPDRVTALSVGTKTATTLQLNFTPPTSLNTIENFEVFIDEVPYQIISGSGQIITGLAPGTVYKKIEVRAIDIYYNRADQMAENLMLTTSTL